MREDVAFSLLAQLRDGGLDLVMALVDPDALDGLDGVRLLDEELVLVAPLDHPLARVRRVPVERLAREALVAYGGESALRSALLALVPAGRIVAEANELETLRELTARGDIPLMTRRSRAVAQLLSAADQARLTCPRGTDLALDLSGRERIPDDGKLTERGSWGNLPAGEGFISPTSGDGRIVASALAGLGLPTAPLRLEVSDGRLVDGDERFLDLLDTHGAAGRNLAELGVGTNENARLTGNVLEDEKMLGSAHIAFGASAGIGGTVAVPVHLDCVVVGATLKLDDITVLDQGSFVLDA